MMAVPFIKSNVFNRTRFHVEFIIYCYMDTCSECVCVCVFGIFSFICMVRWLLSMSKFILYAYNVGVLDALSSFYGYAMVVVLVYALLLFLRFKIPTLTLAYLYHRKTISCITDLNRNVAFFRWFTLAIAIDLLALTR